MFYTGFHPPCALCASPVSLTESMADEDGQAVHEECYVSMVVSKKASARASLAYSSSGQARRKYPFLVRCSGDLDVPIPRPPRRSQGGCR